MAEKKFCPNCGHELYEGTKFCPGCGASVSGERAQQSQPQQPQIVINNVNTNTNMNNNAAVVGRRMCNKWVSFALCLLLGYVGAHKFYEGKVGMGILYLFTMGLFGIGWMIDTIAILFKPNPYAV